VTICVAAGMTGEPPVGELQAYHVVLFERAGRAEAAGAGQPDSLLHIRGRRLADAISN
jgi:hypothetical protein